ncbi:hypothetical protein LAZ67_3003173 [Cordylochernes scorpioides]|uniref:Mos1 transposase HTH domain-containing protein n=1 Tax=Cordylochernes scorpioides TaxID=51811 RepID=A0ABY6KA52_9ARAC|nr:hypothetical protein LAZ67_3003173 [Cordylochernes scorpioides]
METSETLHWTPQQQKIDMDPEQQLYTPKIENIAVIEMFYGITIQQPTGVRQKDGLNRLVFDRYDPGSKPALLQWPPILAKVQPHQRVQVTKRDPGTFLEYIRTFSNFSMDCIEKQRVCIEFCFKLGKTTSVSFQMLKQAFKEDALSQSRTFEWFARFKTGRTSVKDDLHTGRPLSIRNPENALKIKSSIKENPRITIRRLGYLFWNMPNYNKE